MTTATTERQLTTCNDCGYSSDKPYCLFCVDGIVPVNVGDFFCSSWGYDQTNVDFYKVIALTPSGKSVKVQKWSSAVARDNGPQVYVVPGDRPSVGAWVRVPEGWSEYDRTATAPVETRRLNRHGKGAYIAVSDHQSGSLWDGKPQYETGSGWGH